MISQSGIIYVYPGSRRTRWIRRIGVGLVTFSLATIIFLFTPVALTELRYTIETHEDTALAQFEQNAAKQSVRKEANSLGLSSYFSVFIPKVNAKANIVPNVSVQEKSEYEKALMEGVAHARGTYFPGQGKNIFLFAHSTDSPLNFTRYNAVFYLLGKLEKGDQFTIYFLDRKYEYEVAEKIIAAASDTSWIYRDFGFETVILQTCDPPGTTIRRLLVLAKPV